MKMVATTLGTAFAGSRPSSTRLGDNPRVPLRAAHPTTRALALVNDVSGLLQVKVAHA